MALANITNNILTDSGILVTNLTPTTRTLTINGVTYDLSADRSWTIATGVGGSGTTNYLPKFTGASTIGNSLVFDNGSNVGINRNNPTRTLDILGGTGIGTVLKLEGASGTTTYLQLAYNGATNAQSGYIGYNSSSQMQFFTNDTLRATIDASGNLGLGVTPSAWFVVHKVMQLGGNFSGTAYAGAFTAQTNDNVINLFNNAFVNSSNVETYYASAEAAKYVIRRNAHEWYNAPSGTAGNAISFTQAMTLNASGNLSIGNTNDTFKLDVTGTGRFSGVLNVFSTGSTQLFLRSTGGGSNRDWQFQTNETAAGDISLLQSTTAGGATYSRIFNLSPTGAATFSSSVTANGGLFTAPVSINGSSVPSDRWFEVTGTTSGKVFGAVFNPTFTYTGSNIYGIYVGNNFGSGTITNSYNLYIEGTSVGSATITNRYGLYQAGGSDKNYFAGNVGIGTTSPDVKLQVRNDVNGNSLVAKFSNLDTNPDTGSYIGFSTGYDATARIGALREGAGNNSSLVFLPMVNETPTERMRITSGGEACIGRTTAYGAGFLLNVQGNIYASAAIVTGAPSGGSSANWKLGGVNTGTCVPSSWGDFTSWFTGTVIDIEINGTTYKIPAVISNYC
jgi:hypothetical protein